MSGALYTAPHSCLSLVSWVSSSQAVGTHKGRGLAEASVVQYVCALVRHHTTNQFGHLVHSHMFHFA
uniref:Secreted protein n=1 Tax=Mesocestoides corti TaxID=53468 RepID=A0A5K3FWQ1_MESCO